MWMKRSVVKGEGRARRKLWKRMVVAREKREHDAERRLGGGGWKTSQRRPCSLGVARLGFRLRAPARLPFRHLAPLKSEIPRSPGAPVPLDREPQRRQVATAAYHQPSASFGHRLSALRLLDCSRSQSLYKYGERVHLFLRNASMRTNVSPRPARVRHHQKSATQSSSH